ncbi:hypothetical protein D3C87_1661140 [compost metagenome]
MALQSRSARRGGQGLQIGGKHHAGEGAAFRLVQYGRGPLRMHEQAFAEGTAHREIQILFPHFTPGVHRQLVQTQRHFRAVRGWEGQLGLGVRHVG